MEGMEFVDDSTLMVFRSNTNFKINLDVWQLKNNKWKLVYANINMMPEKNQKINGNYCGNWFTYGSLSDHYIWCASSTPFDLMNDEIVKNGTYQDLWDKQKDYYLENDLKQSIMIYKFNGVK